MNNLRQRRAAAKSIAVALIVLVTTGWTAATAAVRQPFVPLDDALVLSQSSVQVLAQDREGYLWIGTQAGLNRYDGYSIDSWYADPDDPDTLSHGYVRGLRVARDNALWVATARGLNRLEPETRTVTQVPLQLDDGTRHHPAFFPGSTVEDRDGSIYALATSPASAGPTRPVRWRPGQQILTPVPVEGLSERASESQGPQSLVVDRAGRIWMANPAGLWRLDRSAGRFDWVFGPEQALARRWVGEHIAAADPEGGVLYASTDGLYRVDPDAAAPVRLLRPTEHGLGEDWVRAVAADSRGAIWLTQPGRLIRIDPISGSWRSFDKPGMNLDSTANSGYRTLWVGETPDGSVWLAGLFGLARFDQETGQIERYRHDPNDPHSAPPTLGESGYRIFADRFGVLWVGGILGGLARVTPHGERFVHVSDRTPSVTSRNIVRAIAEQTTGRGTFVWTANQNHGITVWRRDGPRDYSLARHDPAEGDVARLNVIRSFAMDPTGEDVWVVGTRALGRIRGLDAALELIEFDHPDPPFGTRASGFIDDHTLIVAGSIGPGNDLWRIDTQTLQATPIDVGLPPEADRSYALIFDFITTRDGRLAAATSMGLAMIELEDNSTRWHIPTQPGNARPENNLFSIAAGRRGEYWAGTSAGGLVQIDFVTQDQPVFRRFTTEQGLPDNTVYAVLRSDSGALWLSTNRGVSRFNPQTGEFRYYTPGDGLQGWEFNHAVAHRGETGTFYFGGINGWNAFQPDRIRRLVRAPELDLDTVRVNGQAVETGPENRLPALAHDDNELTIDYVGLHFAAPERVRYTYRLDGLESDWVDANSTRRARYPDLAPGAYRFELRAQNLDGVWSEPETLASFEIRRPPWATPWAWALYAAIVALLVLGVLARQRQLRRNLEVLVWRRTAEVHEQKDLIERQARELEQALAARTTLFASISHEFRTPLTLIQAGIDKLERNPDPEAAATARKYLARLLRLVEQLLDLSRLGLTRSTVHQSPWQLDSLVSKTVEAFRSVAEHRGIDIEYRSHAPWRTTCAQDLVEKILLNLVGNAIKFTPAGGRIRVELTAATPGVALSVADTGPGIAASEQERIFERFYRTESNSAGHQPGAGVGLALVLEAARAAGGDVRVDSRPGDGARFTVTLPAERGVASGAQAPPDRARQQLDLAVLNPAADRPRDAVPHPANPDAPTVLVVEDNADLRRYIAESLSPRWHVVEAEDGEAGHAMARTHDCDLIISDLMMPRVDGFEMLERLRGDVRTSHVPVLFLTARQDEETRLKAFALSADAFLPKPFNVDELMARLDQMIDSRNRLRDHIHRSHGGRGTEDAANESGDELADRALAPRDRDFLADLDQWLGDHHGDPEITIADMAGALHITARTLQRKLRSLADRTPAAYLRDYRMAQARKRLQQSDHPVTEIALEVGYTSSQYFSRVFRKLHGEPPESWRQAHARQSDGAHRET